jgi:hypothetical protein
MFETTHDFFSDAFSFKLEDSKMLDIVLTLTGFDDKIPLGVAIYELHKLTPKQRNYICCVLLERDQDPEAWEAEWSKLESEVFE